MFQHDVFQLLVLLLGVDITGRVVRVTDQDRLGARGDQPLELLHRRQREIVGDRRRDRLDVDARLHGEAVVVGIERLGHQHLVARVEADGHRHEDRFRSSDRDHHVVGRHVDADAPVVIGQFAAIALVSGRVPVLEHLVVYVFHGVDGDLRGPDVGLADVEVVYLDSPALRRLGERHQLADRGGGQIDSLVGQVRHDTIF